VLQIHPVISDAVLRRQRHTLVCSVKSCPLRIVALLAKCPVRSGLKVSTTANHPSGVVQPLVLLCQRGAGLQGIGRSESGFTNSEFSAGNSMLSQP